uniref:E3 ubiquitin-protein ligase TRIM21-like n=1 Tax=Sinocyclocheilus anshuiensis TaxID=1608454 RepID=A0A671NI58_9TELE
MASSSGPLNEELQCSICLDVFNNPVTTPCGHNFCRTCLNKCWKTNPGCFCPICNEKFSKRPHLKINITLREVVQHFKEKLELGRSEVFCDICDERKQKKSTEKQAKDLIKELQQDISELKRRHTELEQLSQTEDDLHLLQIYSSICTSIRTKNWTQISTDFNTNVCTLNKALIQLKELEIIHKNLVLKMMQQYAVDVTLDPDTAYPELILSKDGKQVRHGNIKQNLPNYPKRFESCLDILGKEAFSSGKFYFEVQVKGKAEWDLGVARESINRKGKVRLSPEDGCLTLVLRNENQYKACENPCVSLSQRETLEKVGVFVDYEEGLVSFYDVESSSHIYSFTGQSFTNKLYPFLSPCYNDEGKNSSPLIISPVISNK